MQIPSLLTHVNYKMNILFICIYTLIILIIFKSFQSFSSDQYAQKSYKPFIVAKSKMHKGEFLTIENTKIVFLDLGDGGINYIHHNEFNHFEGLPIDSNLDVNTPILKTDITTLLNPEERIPQGKRLFVLDMPIGPIVSVLKTGDTIDVIAQIDMPTLGNVTETVLDAVKIAAIGNKADASRSDENENQFLSFYLTPDEVKIISFMKPYSHFSVVLRNPEDTALNQDKAVNFNQFLQNEKIQKIIQADSFKIINGRKLKKID